MPRTSTAFLNDLARQLSSRYTNREDLLRAAYDTIRLKINWNEKIQAGLSDGNIAAVYKAGTGNSSEINLMLFKLLKKLDFETYPVVLSTRDNGTILKYSPSLRQINYAIVYARTDNKDYLLDATERYMPSFLIPTRCLNTEGRVVDKTKDIWLPVTTNRKERNIVIYDLNIADDLILKGSMTISRYDYAAFDFRKQYFKFNSQSEYTEDFLRNRPGMTVKDMQFENLDSIYKSLTERVVVEIANQVFQGDSSLYFTPAYFEELRQNPFQLETRKYPVDFGVLSDKTMILNLSLPTGYSVASSPKSQILKLKDNSAYFMYEVAVMDKNVKITTKFGINKAMFLPEDYSDLREFYNQVIKKQYEPIILKRKV